MAFKRYDGAVDSSEDRMRQPVSRVATTNSSLGELLNRYEEFTHAPDNAKAMYPWADRFVMGIPLPSWQRAQVWLPAQKVSFIQSIWSEVDLGSYLCNDFFQMADSSDYSKGSVLNSDVLLDGQQRLTAIEEYLNNRFSVADGSGVERYWSDLTRAERRRFSGRTIGRAHVISNDESVLREIYDLRAFGGTPHQDSERAVK